MRSTQELQIAQFADKVQALSRELLQQSQALSGTALYLETLSHKYDILAKSIKDVLNCPETLLDLPLEVL